MRNFAKGLATIACLLLMAEPPVFGVPEPPSYRHDAEDGVLRWRSSRSASSSDVEVKGFQHRSSDQTSHSGRFSERISFTAGNGTKFLLTHRVGQASVLEELRITVWVNANRPGIQIIGHVVLPDALDPETGRPVVAILRGDSYDTPGQWQRLTLHKPLLLLERQQRILNRNQGRGVSLRGSYLHEVVINAYTGPGTTQIFLDDLEVTPFLGKMPPEPLAPALEARLPLADAPAEVRQGQLFVNERPARVRAVLYRGESVERLKAVGFNAVWFDDQADPKLLRRAHEAGLWVIAQPPAPNSVDLDAPPWNSVLLWQMGKDLSLEEGDHVREFVAWMRQHDSRGKPITGNLTSGLLPYSRLLDVVTVGRDPLPSGFSPRDYRDWLQERTRLTRAGTPLWTWIRTQPAASFPPRHANGTNESRDSFGLMNEPEQLRLFSYAALAAGARGLGFWSADSLEAGGPENSERFIALGLLNLELRLMDGLLQGATRLDTVAGNPNDVEATLFRAPNGATIMLASWFGKDSQYVPDQAAGNSVSFIVPGLPEATALWRISLSGIEPLPRGRVAGGVPVTLKEFDVASIVLFSNDQNRLKAIRNEIDASRKEAARLALKLAELKRGRVERVDRELAGLGRPALSAPVLLERSREFYASGWRDFQSGRYDSAYQNAQRSMRPLRVLQQAHWKAAVKSLPSPLTSPYATAFSTLPEHWRFVERLRRGRFGPNLASEADFENAEEMADRGWAYAQQTIEGVEVTMELSPESPHEGSYCLRLGARPIDPEIAPAVPETAPIRVTSAPVSVLPGQVVRIAGWVRVPQPIMGSVAGATVTDSLGGEGLALRWRETTGWQKFVVDRPVDQSRDVRFNFTLTGFGQASFDDVSVQILQEQELMTKSPSSRTRKRLDLQPTSRRLKRR